MVAWRPPDPPLPEIGIELNFGLDDQGSGDIQPETPVGNDGAQQEQAARSKPKVKEETQKKVEEVLEKEKIREETKPVEDKPEEKVASKEESPVVVKEKKEEVKPVEKPAEKPVEKKVEPKKVEPKVEEKPKVNQDAVYKPNAQQSTAENKPGATKEGKPGNHGDNPGTVGDKGNPEGTLDSKALYGKPGGGAGGVSMSGFNGFDWPQLQTPTLPDEAYGVYEFIVKVDDQGVVTSVRPLQRGLSLEAERKLKEVIQRLVFLPKGSNLPPQSEGRITFRVVSK